MFCFFVWVRASCAHPAGCVISFPLPMANCTSALSRSCPALASSSVNPPVGGASPTGGRTDFDGKFSAGKLHCWMAILVMSGFGRAILFLLRSRSSMRFLLDSCDVKDTRIGRGRVPSGVGVCDCFLVPVVSRTPVELTLASWFQYWDQSSFSTMLCIFE